MCCAVFATLTDTLIGTTLDTDSIKSKPLSHILSILSLSLDYEHVLNIASEMFSNDYKYYLLIMNESQYK